MAFGGADRGVAMGATASAQRRVAKLAAMLPVHRAFHWLHLHQPQIRQWLLETVAIPAPPFGEEARARWFLSRFEELGLENVHADAEGNALGELRGAEESAGPVYLLLSAHLDTVFPAGTVCDPVVEGGRISAPGACDNGAGLSALLAVAAALRFAGIRPPMPILFAANVGEEGEGDLRGMRHLFERGEYRGRIAGAIALEGSGSSTVVTRALGSVRLRVTVNGPGGHSWSDFGAPNPILLLCRALAEVAEMELPADPRTTLNAGQISGGTSINSIPESASVLLDIRSTDPGQLRRTTDDLLARMEAALGAMGAVIGGGGRAGAASLEVERIGDRPAGALPEDSPLMHTVRAVDRHLGLRTESRIGSTDANLPMSLGIPAIAMGTGGSGGGIHTLAEWYDPAGREPALRRIVLAVLDLSQTLRAEV